MPCSFAICVKLLVSKSSFTTHSLRLFERRALLGEVGLRGKSFARFFAKIALFFEVQNHAFCVRRAECSDGLRGVVFYDAAFWAFVFARGVDVQLLFAFAVL